jgi:hypothetical protein
MSSIKNISLYIPHIFANFDENFVKDVFEREVGKVSRVDFVSKIGRNGAMYNAAYIHFDFWYESESILEFQQQVINPNIEAHFVYDGQWYWIVLENTAKKFVPGQRKTRIDIGDASLVTPTKQNTEQVAPNAPEKKRQEDLEDLDYLRRVLHIDEDEINMEEIVDAIEEEEDNIIIHEEYVKNLEEENEYLKAEVKRLHRIIINNPSYSLCPAMW